MLLVLDSLVSAQSLNFAISFFFLYSEEYEMLVQKLAEEQAKVDENETKIAVMTMLKEGSVPETLPIPGTPTLLCNLFLTLHCCRQGSCAC